MFRWIARWRNTCGYGVQSPTDYRFLKYVIRERGEYYAYADLRACTSMSRAALKKGLLFFRIANALQPDVLCDTTCDAGQFVTFFQSGSRKLTIDNDYLASLDAGKGDAQRLLLRLSCRDSSYEEISGLLRKLPQSAVVLLEDVRSDAKVRKSYHSLLHADEVRVCFDLGTFAILFLTNHRYKQTYYIYF
ncbi:MAG: hypothetical protein ACI4BA_06520 [Prevotella sp.]